MSLPKTITREDIQEALTASLKKHIEIKELKVQPNEAGGNYCSDIYRITVKYTVENNADQPQELKLVLKDLHENLAESSKESFMYQTVLPKINAIFEAIHDGGRFSPRVYLTQRDSREQYLFEDLNASGYTQCDHFVGFNEAQTKCVLAKLGQFHATSMMVQKRHPEIVANLKNAPFCQHLDFCEKMLNDNVAYVTKIVEKWPEFTEIAAKLRDNTGDKFRRKFLGVFERQDYQFSVIVHSDLWTKNILIMENAKTKPLDAIFVDYQFSFLGSPGIDFNYFVLTSVQLDVMNSEAKRNSLIQHYYESFEKTLQCLAFDSERIPTLQMLMTEIENSEYISYFCLMFSLPLTVLCEELAKDMDFAAFFDDERTAVNRKDMFSNQRVLAMYKYMLPRFDKLGLLD